MQVKIEMKVVEIKKKCSNIAMDISDIFFGSVVDLDIFSGL